MMERRYSQGFTLLELMLAIVISLFVIGTYLRFFAHSTRVEAHNNMKSNITLKGEHILNTLDNAIRLTGLGNTSAEFRTGNVIATATGTAASVNGGTSAGPVDFSFISPYGGPVTKVLAASNQTPACTITVQNSASLHGASSNPLLLLINHNNVYRGTLNGTPTTNQFTLSTLLDPAGNSVTGQDCAALFPPLRTLVTGENRTFQLTYGDAGFLFQVPLVSDGLIRIKHSKAEMPYILLQFLTESDASGGEGELSISRTWTALPADREDIKAVRIAFVLATKEAREGAATENAFQYCFFEPTPYCFSAPANTNFRYAAFSRVIYLRNYDSLKRHLLEY